MSTIATAAPKLTIPSRFNGPPDTGQGGYVCGRLGAFIEGPAQVMLRRPVPLGIEMQVETLGNHIDLRHGDVTIATATAARVDVQPTRQQAFDAAVDVSLAYRGFTEHPYPTCFVCGPLRAKGDGLRVFPGQVGNEALVAAPWIPEDSVADGAGLVRPEFVWAALDCPSGWALIHTPPSDKLVVLGTLAVAIYSRPRAGRRHVLTGWPLRSQGRKFVAAAALWSEVGELNAVAEATWIEVSEKRGCA